MVVTRAFSLDDVFVASQSISEVHVTQLFDQLIHLIIVVNLLRVNHRCLFFDDPVETSLVRQVKRIVDVKNWVVSSLPGSSGLPRNVFHFSFVVSNLLHFLLHVVELQMRVNSPLLNAFKI